MKILVTGGAGFIGSHTILALLRAGHTVVNIDNLNDYYDPTLKRARLALFGDAVEHYEIDIADKDAVVKVFASHTFDAVCHLAAQAGVRYSIENPFVYGQSNYIGTLHILECAKQQAVPHVVVASTSSVYGNNTKVPFHEDDRVDEPISIYSATKRGTELLGSTYNHLFGLNVTMLRFFTVYGPWGRPDMALFLFTKAILENKPIQVFNNGEMRRDFTYVTDIVSGILSVLEHPGGFQIYNLGRGEPTNLMEFIHTIEDALGKKAVLDMLPMQQGDLAVTWADITKAQHDLGYAPQISVREGVDEFVKWYLEYYKPQT